MSALLAIFRGGYSQIYFSEQIIISKGFTDRPISLFAVDLDGDEDMDILSASTDDKKIAWYENTDGKGSFGPQQIITTETSSPWSVYASDIDGDGDKDVLSASLDNKVAWYENTDGKGTFGPIRIISIDGNGAIRVCASDIDGDGDMDVLAAFYTDHSLAWFENTDGKGTYGPMRLITTETDLVQTVYLTDIDGDGDMDVLSSSMRDNKVIWFENTDGKGSFGPMKMITSEASWAYSVYAADMDGDGDLDVLSASNHDNKISWYENINGYGVFGPQRVISYDADAPWSVAAADLDNDGDMDVLSASAGDDKIAYYENTDGKGIFSKQYVISTKADGAAFVLPSDIDGDGKTDVLSASFIDDKIAWYRNREKTLWDGLTEHLIDADMVANSIDFGDPDGDGDNDLVAGSQSETAFYENLDSGSGTFYKHIIGGGASVVCFADMDSDNLKEVLSGTSKEIAWWKDDGVSSYSKHLVDDKNFSPRSISGIDLDGDGDMDILAASSSSRSIAWWECHESEQYTKNTISSTIPTIKSVGAIDMDLDGDLDLLSVESSTIAWWENDGLQNFSKKVIASNLSFGIYAVAIDLDEDNDVDVIGLDEYANQVILWENNGQQNFSMTVIDNEIKWPVWLCVKDLDNDGDLDLIAVSNTDNYVCLYENFGENVFLKQIIRSNFNGASLVKAADCDNDGDLDIIGVAGNLKDIVWWENTLNVDPNHIASDIRILPDTLFFFIGPGQPDNEDELLCTIENSGSATLYVRNISSEQDWITEIDTLNFLVKLGGELQIRIRCNANGLFNGIYQGCLDFQSNDPETPLFCLPLILEMRNGADVNYTNEIEPNNNKMQAQLLFAPSPTGITGTISVSDAGEIRIQNDDVEDLYEITLQSGYIKLSLFDFTADLDIILMRIVDNNYTIWGSNHRGTIHNEVFEKTNLDPGTYYAGISIYDAFPIQNNSSYSFVVEGDINTEIKKIDYVDSHLSLKQNYPNPFNHLTRIDFRLAESAQLTIKIYDMTGREVRILADAFYDSGIHWVLWDGSDNSGNKMSPGLYYYILETTESKQVKSALLLNK